MYVDISTYNRLETLALYGSEGIKNLVVRLIEQEYKKKLNTEDSKFDDFLRKLRGNE